ncbi:hypothetical protein PIB30_000989 [Stylosanthes scabra]|uniref:Uncharacterized protein n=1 Tax=Stylosanthes scabra TaxID=79078 RepID=A0ABU6T374_9FABA|nr:hypothetical protein [Stylosanthes scabra]
MVNDIGFSVALGHEDIVTLRIDKAAIIKHGICTPVSRSLVEPLEWPSAAACVSGTPHLRQSRIPVAVVQKSRPDVSAHPATLHLQHFSPCSTTQVT